MTAETADPTDIAQARILVVDDVEDNRALLVRRLGRRGFEVVEAEDGPTALRIVAEQPVDLILLDMTMPGMDGGQVLAELRRSPRTAMLPVIMVTARSASEDIAAGLELGADDYVTKPIDLAVLLARMSAQLRRQQAERALVRANAELEARVQQRTEALTRTNASLKNELEHRTALESSLRHTARSAERANQAKSAFLANMSHEFRTPLSTIIGFSDIIRRHRPTGMPEADLDSYVGHIRTSGLRLLTIVDNILDHAQLEAGRTAVQNSTVDVDELVISTIGMAASEAIVGGVSIDYLAEPSGMLIRCDEALTRRMLINLLSNAVKFSPNGGAVRVRSSGGVGESLVLSVTDNGIGMSGDEIAHALQPFAQVDDGGDRRFEGTGLGLPLTKSLIELHGGQLEILSSPGAGTSVTLHFPTDRICGARGALTGTAA